MILKSKVSARFAPISVIAMGACSLLLYFLCLGWYGLENGQLYDFWEFVSFKHSWFIIAALAGIAIFGGMFVVPLYAFLTTTVSITETGRTIAANNVVNSGCMVIGALVASALSALGVSTTELLILVALMCIVAAYLGWKLHKACDDEPAFGLERHHD